MGQTTRLLKLAEVFDFSNTHWVESISVQSAQDPGKAIRKRIRLLDLDAEGEDDTDLIDKNMKLH